MSEQTPSPYNAASINHSIHDARRAARRRLFSPAPGLEAQALPDTTGRQLFFGSPSSQGRARSHGLFGSPSPVEGSPPIQSPPKKKFREYTATPARISKGCKDKFNHYSNVQNEHAKRYLRKLMDICTTTADRCENPRDILTHLQNKYNKNQKRHTIIIHEGQDSAFHQLYKYWEGATPAEQPHIFRGLMNNDEVFPRFSVRFQELNDVGAGVTRNFFQMVVDDMVSRQGIFVSLDASAKSNRYTITNTPMDPNIFKFVGEFLAFAMLNEIPIPVQLSRSLLTRMIYKDNEVDEDMDVMYAITDYPESSQTILNELMFSEYVELDDIEDNMTSEQRFEKVKEYVRKKIRALSATPSVQAVANAFFLRNDARRHNWTIDRLDQLISGNSITPQSIDALIAHLKETAPSQPIFIKMLQKAKSTKNIVFVQRLMQYWTGMKKINIAIQPPYQVMTNEASSNSLPMASTCFNQLKIPKDVIDEDDLMARFNTAIEHSGTTFGLD